MILNISACINSKNFDFSCGWQNLYSYPLVVKRLVPSNSQAIRYTPGTAVKAC